MVKEENTDQASKYMEEIPKEFEDKRIIRPSTVVEVDSIINVKEKICQYKNISFTYDISPLKDPFINHMDLAVIVGILLDNAIEAATRVSDSWISLKLKQVKGLVLIEVENSFDGIVKKMGLCF